MRGEVLGKYRILDKLGQGGMGAVYHAEHVSIGRKAAVKVLLPELSQKPEIVNRFINEARASTAIAHPGIVQVFDADRHHDGSAFIVMELLSGESLDDRLKRLHRLPEDETVRIARQCASALAAAHDAGIVHRDLKPGNIFLAADPEMEGGERVKILDFGIAKLTDMEESGHFKTRTGSMLGTPVYMSPEQCRGAGSVDHRSDIYSLGCVLFRILCGRPPFLAEGIGEIIACHLREPPPTLRSIEPTVSPQLDALVQRTLAKSPDNRFASMAELADALRSLRRAASTIATSGPAHPTGHASLYPGQATPFPAVPAFTPPAPAAPGWSPATSRPPGPMHAPWTATPAESGRPPSGMPAGASAPPFASPPTTLGAAASQQLVNPTRRRRSHILIASVAGLVAAGGIVLVLALDSGAGNQDAALAGKAQVPKLLTQEQRDDAETPPDPAEAAPEAQQDQRDEESPGEIAMKPDEVAAGAEPDGTIGDSAGDQAQAVAPITVTIESTPDGALVFRPGEEEPLGKTPYELVTPPESGEITLEIRKRGYRNETISFAGYQSSAMKVDLKKHRSRPSPKSRKSIHDDALLSR